MQLVIILCTTTIASAGSLHRVGYSATPAVSHVSYSTHGLLTNPVTSYAIPPTLASYGAPSVSYQSYSSHSVPSIASYGTIPVVAKQISPITTYSSAPAVSYQSISSHSTPLAYPTSSVFTKIYAKPSYSTYGAPAISAYSSPIAAKIISPNLTYSSVSSNSVPRGTYASATPAYSTYSTISALKPAIGYSAAPAVTHVAYSGLGASYSW